MITTKLPDGSAFSIGIVMSRDEAMKLPVKDRPICFRISSEMYHAVWELVAEASHCWKECPPSESFDAEKASSVAVKLCLKIAEEVERIMPEERAAKAAKLKELEP